MTPPDVRAYALEEHDGLLWIYNAGTRHSTKGIAPVDVHEREVLNAVVDLLNYGKTSSQRLAVEAFSMYINRLW